MYKKITLVALFSIFTFYSGFSQCLMRELSFNERIDQSNAIIEGKVISSESFWANNRTYIYTSNIVEIYKVFKGNVNSTKIEVITEGGLVDGVLQSVEPSLQLEEGSTGIFLLISNIKKPSKAILFSSYEAYGSMQGFLKYDFITKEASDPFKIYSNIEENIYLPIQNRVASLYKEVAPFDINSSGNSAGKSMLPPAITSFSPTTITAGTGSILTINGSGFGASQSTSVVRFKNADDGGGTYITPLATQYVSWSDTKIEVRVPARTGAAGTAGTGTIQVTVGASTVTSSSTLTVSYGELNRNSGSPANAYKTHLIGQNGAGGYTWRMYTGFDSNTSAKDAFKRALSSWRCATYVNWPLGATTSVNTVASDGVNVVRFDSGSELAAGTLGVCSSWSGECATGVWPITELDITFDDGTSWYYGTGTPGGSQYDFESVVLHELGHGHQLTHVINTSDVMNYSISNGVAKRTLNSNNIAAGNDVLSRSTIVNSCGNAAMTLLTSSNCALGSPTAAFIGSPTTGCSSSLTVNFTDQSTGGPTSWAWDINNDGTTDYTTQNPSHTYTATGKYTVKLTATNSNGSSIETKTDYITLGGSALPYVETFDGATFPPSSWSITNSDANLTWVQSSTITGSAGVSTKSAFLNHYTYNVNLGTTDLFTSPILSLSGVTSPKLEFNVAYARYSDSNSERLRVLLSTDCGSTFPAVIYNKSGKNTDGNNLPTVNMDGIDSPFSPTAASHWRKEIIDLSSYVGQNIVIRFESTNGWGNNLYIDDFSISGTVCTAPSITSQPVDRNICETENTTFSVTASGSSTLNYQWQVDSGSGFSNISNGGVYSNATTSTLNITSATSVMNGYIYRCIVTNSCGSVNSTNATLTVKPKPTLSSTLTPSAICSGNTFSYTATSSASSPTFSWTRAAVSGITEPGSSGSTASISEVLTNTTTAAINVTYAVTVTSNGCSNTQNVVVSVKPKPTLSSTLSPPAICSGTTFSYTATSSASSPSLTWTRAAMSGITEPSSSGSTASISEVLTNTTTAAINVTYAVTVTSNGCSNTQNVVVSVDPTPTLSSTLTPAAICSGTTFSYTATSSFPGPSFSWTRAAVSGITEPASSGSTASISEVLTNTTASGINVTYAVTVTSNGCSNTQNVVVSVDPTPTLSSTLTPAAICSGTTFSYTATSSFPGPSFSWTRATVTGITEAASSGSTASISETLTNTTTAAIDVTYAVTLTSNGCSNTQDVVVSVDPTLVPSVSISISMGSNPMCSGESTTFTATPTNGGPAPAYQWILDGANVGTNSATYTNGALINGQVVSCVLTSNEVCVSPTTATSNSITMSVSSTLTPDVSIAVTSGSNPSCEGSSVTFTATPINGGSTPSYQWKVGATNVGTDSSVYITTALADGEIVTCVMTSSSSCASPTTAISNSITITVNPVPAAIVSGGGAICAGSTTDVNIELTGTAPWTITYSDGTNSTFVSGINISPLVLTTGNAGNYTVTDVSDANCTGSSGGAAVVTVNSIPAAPGATSNSPVCAGNTVMLFADTITGATYSWSGPNSYSTTDQNPILTASSAAAGTYSVTATVNGCTGTAGTVAVAVNPLPAQPAITQKGDTLSSTAAVSYQWIFNGAQLSGANSQDYLPTVSGNYQVTITDSNGCSSTSAVVTVIITSTGIKIASAKEEGFTIYPNPFNNTAAVIIPPSWLTGRNTSVFKLYNVMGEAIRSIEITNEILIISREDLANGIYIFKVILDTKEVSGKVIISQ